MTKMRMAMTGAGLLAIAAAAGSAPPSTAPVATYWMDVTTQSGMGGMTPGSQPDMGQMMAMMTGQAPPVTHMLRLRLASKTPAPASPQADHLIPPALKMGASLPLVTPGKAPVDNVKGDVRGKLLVYWGCGEHVGPGQPLVVDLATLASGKAPESIKRWGSAMGRTRQSYGGPTDAPGFGEWPNPRDGRPVPPGASLIGAHKVQGNYSPTIDFTLAQDFMGPMSLASGGKSPSGGAVVRWNAVPQATGYALGLFGANDANETIMWSNAKTAGFANLDYLSPSDAAKAVAAGEALAPSTTQCTIPAEVVQAVPMGMVMSVAYGPEVHFAEAPKAPKWAVTVRYKSGGSLMHGMEDMMGGMER